MVLLLVDFAYGRAPVLLTVDVGEHLMGQSPRCTIEDDAAIAQADDAIGMVLGERHVMDVDQRRCAALVSELDQQAHDLARRHWSEAGVENKIELRVGQVADALRDLKREGRAGWFDFAFIDADKPGYSHYYDCCLELVRPGGLLVFDNVFMGGAVAEAAPRRRYVEDMKAFNKQLRDDTRVSISMVPVGDGLTLALIRS